MATITFSFTTTDESKTRIRHAIARAHRGMTGALTDPDPAKQEAIDAKIDFEVREHARMWLKGNVTAYEYEQNKPGVKTTNEAEDAPLVLTL
jgi:hypothetical protein